MHCMWSAKLEMVPLNIFQVLSLLSLTESSLSHISLISRLSQDCRKVLENKAVNWKKLQFTLYERNVIPSTPTNPFLLPTRPHHPTPQVRLNTPSIMASKEIAISPGFHCLSIFLDIFPFDLLSFNELAPLYVYY